MGNAEAGDGYKFRGRGFIQLTGRSNYEAAGKALGLDLLGNPDLASDPATASKIAIWYWKSRGISSAAQRGDVNQATRLINGGTNGLSDRQQKFVAYLEKAKSGQLAVAMNGGRLGSLPTLVGEREPEVLDPMGQIHKSVSSYLSSPSADAPSLAVNMALKEAARRSAGGPDNKVNEAFSKIASASGALNGNVEDLLKQILEAMRAVADNTGKALEQTPQEPAQQSTASQTVNNNGGNIFSLAQHAPQQSAGAGGMSPAMRNLVSGG